MAPRARNRMSPTYFSVYIFLPKGWPLENLRGEKWERKTDFTFHTRFVLTHNAQKQFKLTNHGQQDRSSGLSQLFFLLVCQMVDPIFFLHLPRFCAPVSGVRGKCPPLCPSLDTPLQRSSDSIELHFFPHILFFSYSQMNFLILI